MNASKPVKAPTPRVDLIRLEPIIDILTCAIWSGRVANEKPVSVLLIAEQESAKTECLKFFAGTMTLRYLSDMTATGIKPYKNDIERGDLRHLILLDLVRILSHSKGVGERTIQQLATLMEEGESGSSDGGGATQWGSETNTFPKVGVLMGITPSFYNSKKGSWRKTGFMTRFLPVSFRYGNDTQITIHNGILNGQAIITPRPIILPKILRPITIPLPQGMKLKDVAIICGAQNGTYGFRYHKSLRTLAKASALQGGRNSVNDFDVNRVLPWAKFFNGNDTIEL